VAAMGAAFATTAATAPAQPRCSPEEPSIHQEAVATAQPAPVAAGGPAGILRRRPAHTGRGLAPCKRWQVCPRRRPRLVSFKATITVQEYARLLDGGGTVPADGSSVTLGLGRPTAKRSAPLGRDRPRGLRPIEERAWVPSIRRVHILRKAMGDAEFFGLWARRRWEVARIRRSRKRCNSDDTDKLFMPESLEEAEDRAAALHKDTMQSSRREPSQRSCVSARPAGILVSPPKTCHSPHPQKRQRLSKEEVDQKGNSTERPWAAMGA